MPNFFSLTRKSDIANGPVKFAIIDEELCKEFNKPVDPNKYLVGWYDSIGTYLALGKSWNWIRLQSLERIKEENERQNPDQVWIEWCELSNLICDYLEKNFIVECGYISR